MKKIFLNLFEKLNFSFTFIVLISVTKKNNIMKTQKFKNKYGSIDINALINYKAMLLRKAIRLDESFADYIKEFYS